MELIIITYIADILKYTLSGVLVFFIGWFFVRMQLDKVLHTNLLEIKKASSKDILPLRLQAYERIILFMERINPTNMLIRLHTVDMSAQEMQQLILIEIRSEFQHNMSQQLYISNQSWTIIKKMMEDTLAMVNNAVNALPANSTALLLSKTILTHLEQLENNPYDIALKVIKEDIQHLF